MAESKLSRNTDSEKRNVEVDIPDNAELWVAVQQEDGYAPAIIVGGNPQGLRLLANYCNALAESGVSGGRLSLEAGAPLLEGSECDMLLVLQSEDVGPAAGPGTGLV